MRPPTLNHTVQISIEHPIYKRYTYSRDVYTVTRINIDN